MSSKQPVLRLGGDYLTQAAVGAVDQDAAESADLGGDGNGDLCLIRVILYHLQKYFFWGRVGVGSPAGSGIG